MQIILRTPGGAPLARLSVFRRSVDVVAENSPTQQRAIVFNQGAIETDVSYHGTACVEFKR